MIGKLTYEQIEQLTAILSTSSSNLRELLNSYQNNPELGPRTDKMLNFCSDVDKYINQLTSTLKLNKDADIVIERIKNNI